MSKLYDQPNQQYDTSVTQQGLKADDLEALLFNLQRPKDLEKFYSVAKLTMLVSRNKPLLAH